MDMEEGMSEQKPAPKRAALALVAEIDEAELGVRLMETAIGLKRPATEKRSAREILAHARQSLGTDQAFNFELMARRAIEYFRECIEQAQRPT